MKHCSKAFRAIAGGRAGDLAEAGQLAEATLRTSATCAYAGIAGREFDLMRCKAALTELKVAPAATYEHDLWPTPHWAALAA